MNVSSSVHEKLDWLGDLGWMGGLGGCEWVLGDVSELSALQGCE